MKKLLFLIFLSLSLFGLDDDIIDTKGFASLKTKESVEKWLDGKIGLKPHNVNYLLPFGYREMPYESRIPNLDYENIEAQLQVSLKLALLKNYFGLKEKYYVAYTQRAFWQLYTDSSPFRETLYSPEAFVEFPIEDKDSIFGARSLTFGYKHESNGQPDTEGIKFENIENSLENFSRSIDYLYAGLRLQHKALISDIRVIAPLDDLSDNPDIMQYRGYTELKFTYFFDEHMFTLMGRGSVSNLKGTLEATYSYPLINDANFYVHIFSGYGESLIDYNRNLTKYSIGFSFSR